MIHESSFWKDDLKARAARLVKRQSQRRWTEKSYALVEQELMLGFYAVRKLIESNKLSAEITGPHLPVLAFPLRKGSTVTLLNRNAIDDLYDFELPLTEQLLLRELCNQVIHSFVFLFSSDENGRLTGVFVASDREKSHAVYHFGLKDIIGLWRRVSRDRANLMLLTPKKGGEFKVHLRHGHPDCVFAFGAEAPEGDSYSPEAMALHTKSRLRAGHSIRVRAAAPAKTHVR
jgi:hypothetical protein